MPTTPLPQAGAAPAAMPKAAARSKPVGPVVEQNNVPSLAAGPIVDETNVAVPTRSKTIDRVDRLAEADAAADLAPDKSPLGDMPTTRKVSQDGVTLGIKESEDGMSVVVKLEHKENLGRENFKVWVIPCYVKADVSIAFDGELKFGDKTTWTLKASSAGALELGVGGTSEAVTAGPFGAVTLTASTAVPCSLSEAREVGIKPFVIDIHGSGKVGIKVEVKKGPTYTSETQLAKWHLFIVHVGAWTGQGFASYRVEQGPDMKRLVAALENGGPAIADAVEKYAPQAVKEVADDGAKWIAESDDAKTIGDATEVVVDKLRDATGVDVGNGAEKLVQVLVDPGGSTSKEDTERLQNDMANLGSATDDLGVAMKDLRTVLLPFCTQEERNAIVAAWSADNAAAAQGGTPTGEWRSKAALLIGVAIQRKTQAKMAEIGRRVKDDKAKVLGEEDLARRIKQSEARALAALTAANQSGIPLERDSKGSPQARQYWQTAMNKYWSPASTAMQTARHLQGEARIAKNEEAAGMLAKAKVVFQEGNRLLK
ncbi:MAG: hypothetical protein ABIQ06_06940 [Caldimonas sp.]